MTDWGREIRVDGVRPAWLADDDSIMWREQFGTTNATKWKACEVLCWPSKKSIRLPAGHWAYRALDAGFEPWPGGDNAPDDWDGGDVLWDDGWVDIVPFTNEWRRDPEGTNHYVIGYHRKSEPTLRTSDEALRRMEALVRRMAARAYDSGWREEAREIVKLLPEPPVDPDLLEARKILAEAIVPLNGETAAKNYLSGEKDNVPAMSAVRAALKRGRELAAER